SETLDHVGASAGLSRLSDAGHGLRRSVVVGNQTDNGTTDGTDGEDSSHGLRNPEHAHDDIRTYGENQRRKNKSATEHLRWIHVLHGASDEDTEDRNEETNRRKHQRKTYSDDLVPAIIAQGNESRKIISSEGDGHGGYDGSNHRFVNVRAHT